MYPRPKTLRHLGQHKLLIAFEDGIRAELDFAPLAQRGGLFEPLSNPDFFGRVTIDPEAESLVWPNGADICPDVVYHLATGAPLPGSLPFVPAKLIRADRAPSPAGT